MTDTDALDILQTIYGYDAFRGQQGDIIATLIAGKDALVLMPTGGGKSLCYQIPSLARAGTGVVVSPLIALMQDQVDALRALNLNAAFINSTLTPAELADTEAALRRGDIDLLYVAPERLMMDSMLALLDECEIALFAIDEAHCVSQWGHDFRKEYLQLSVLHERFPNVPRVALTATADQRTREEIARQLALEDAAHFISGFDRPNIRYTIGEAGQARQQLLRFLDTEHPDDAGIVYCLSRRKVDDTAAWLSEQGRTALPYHAGMSAEDRQRHQQRFLREDGIIIVATIAFGMGIDKPDVRFVAHLSLPKSVEAYYQETGRAGRDGQAADAWMIYGLQDVINLRAMMQQSDADEEHKRIEHHKLESMLGLAEMTTCRRKALLGYFGEEAGEQCGNCDNCLNPPDTWDATEAAQKALSAAYRTGQRFGVNYLIDVLRGNATERIVQFGHDRQSTFGIGKSHTDTEWRSIYRQLIARGLLIADMESYGAVRLDESARSVLRGERTLHFREIPKTVARGTRRRKDAAHAVDAADKPLWEALRATRRRLSEEAGVPAYVVFNDATLLDMLALKPRTLGEMSDVSGVGQAKLERYGDVFLGVINDPLIAEAEIAGG